MIEIYYKRGYKIRYEPSSLCVKYVTFFNAESKYHTMVVHYNDIGKCMFDCNAQFRHRIKKLSFDRTLILSEPDRSDVDNIYFYKGTLFIPTKLADFEIITRKINDKPYQTDFVKLYTFKDNVRRFDIFQSEYSELTSLGKRLERMLIDNNYFDSGSGSPWDRSDISTLYHEIFSRENKVLRKMFDKYFRNSKIKKILS